MPEIVVNHFERSGLSLANLLSGNVEGAVRSAFAPDTLSPEERKGIAEKYFGQTDPGPMRTLLDLTTNPTVLTAAILTLRYPVQADEFAHQNQYLEGQLKKFIPLYDDIASFDEIYRGTPLPDLVQALGERMHATKMRGNELITGAINRYKTAAGGAPVDRTVWNRVVAVLDGTQSPDAPMWEWLASLHKDSPGEEARIRGLVNRMGRERLTIDKLTPAEQQLVKDIRSFYDFTWERAGSDVPGLETAATRRAIARGEKDVMRLGPKLDQYWRRLTFRTPQEVRLHSQQLVSELLSSGRKLYTVRFGSGQSKSFSPSELQEVIEDIVHESPGLSAKQAASAVQGRLQEIAKLYGTSAAQKVSSGSQLLRLGHMLPDPAYLRQLGGASSELADVVEKALYVPNGRDLPVPVRKYRTDLGVLLAHNHTSARDYAWSAHLPGTKQSIGDRVTAVVDELDQGVKTPKGILRDPYRVHMMKDTFLPAILSDSNYEEAIHAARWDGVRQKAVDFLSSDLAKKVVPEKLRAQWLTAYTETPLLGQKKMSDQLARYFYTTTLSLPNIISPIKNLGQTILTTAPMIGLQSTVEGLKETMSRFGELTDLRINKGLGFKEAMEVAFKGFHETELEVDPMLHSLFRSVDDEYAKALTKTGSTKAAIRNIQRHMMLLFSTTERFNRMVAYYGGRHRAMRDWAGKVLPLNPLTGETNIKLENAATREALDAGLHSAGNKLAQWAHMVGHDVARKTQFAGGVTGTPKFAVKWPALARQFLTFPLRYLSFLTRGGPGRIGRALLGSAGLVAAGSMLAGEAGEEMASEMSLWGALPMPHEGSVFGALPVVPPAFQLAGAGIKALQGDPSHLQRATPLLVPGGVGLARVLPAIGVKPAAEFLGKSYADFSRPLPDGRIPLYAPGGALLGYKTETQLMARASGLGDISGAKEQALTHWMLGHRERIAEIRRRYMDALVTNDQRAADRVAEDWAKMYPGMGPLPIKKSHVRSIHLRHDVSRMERTLETMPPEVRQQFSAAAAVAFAQSGPEFLGIEPEVLYSRPTIGSRDAFRPRMTTLGRPIQERGLEQQDRLDVLGGQFLESYR